MLDVCGTGGDKMQLFNVSTTVMSSPLLPAPWWSNMGTGGLLHVVAGPMSRAWNPDPDLQPDRFRECVRCIGVGFLFAPTYHPAFKVIAPVRRELAVKARERFSIYLAPREPGPAGRPAGSPWRFPRVRRRYRRLGRQSAWAVHGSTGDGGAMDELSTSWVPA